MTDADETTGSAPQGSEPGARSSPWVPPGAVTDLQPAPASPKHRAPLIVAVVAVLLAGLVGAGALFVTSTKQQSAASVLRVAGASTKTAGSATFTATTSIAIGGRAAQVITLDGRQDFAHGRADIVMTVPDSAAGTGTMELRLVDGVEYVALPAALSSTSAHWLKISPGDLGLDGAATGPLGSNNPTDDLSFLSGLAGDPQIVGTETQDGVEVTHYRFTIDLTKVAKDLGTASDKLGSSQLSQGLRALDGLVDLTKLPAEAWIDSSHRVRRFRMTIAIDVAGQSMTEVEDIRYGDFGTPVDVTAPDPADVVDFKDAPGALTRLLGGSLQSS